MNVHREGAGEPLVLIHGIGSSWRCWRPVLGALAAQHDVIALDLPGFGGSAPLPAGVARTVPALADAVERQLDALGVESACVAGNSMGGWIALELARRGRAHGVIAISPAGLGTRGENRRSRMTLLALRAVARALEPVADTACGSAPPRTLIYGLAGSRPWRLDGGEAAHAVRALASAPSFRATLDWLFANEPAGLDEIECPVDVLWGSRDAILSPRQAPRFKLRIAHATVRTLPGLGHIPMSDDPDVVARAILDGAARTRAS